MAPASTRDAGSSDERIEYEHPIGTGPDPAEGAVTPDDDATGGEAWNRSLGGNTSAGMRRMLVAVGLFILIGASLLWLIAE
ncbi:MAG TPA: hypothetical protein VD840_05080 [Sinorhizobium sp.]|nr:hypothetical protein [Sinorhizobium sp.]